MTILAVLSIKTMGAGILPVAFNGVSLVFLLGKEHNNQWSDFGGSTAYTVKGPEPRFETAIREGYEETSGLLGSKNMINTSVRKNLIRRYQIPRYSSYLYHVDFDSNLPYFFNLNYEFVRDTTPGIIKKDHNGLYEKKQIKWCTISDMRKLNFRPFYKNIIYDIIKDEKDIKKKLKIGSPHDSDATIKYEF